jgi:hypothetical protein
MFGADYYTEKSYHINCDKEKSLYKSPVFFTSEWGDVCKYSLVLQYSLVMESLGM